tara:strand:+ start:358 stop:546 length:189 start_codon:yes stop_codon:yes gene_type:complete
MIPRIATYISTEIAYKSFFKYIDAPIFIKDKNDFSEVQTTFALRTSYSFLILALLEQLFFIK